MITKEKIIQALKEVIDPEIGISVVDLNMIKDVNISDKKVEVKMVLTAPFCPLTGFLKEEVRNRTATVAEGKDVEVVILDEPWVPPSRT